MAVENGEWILGFLPLFKNEIPGFSVEERTVAKYWWSGNVERDPWEWREIIATEQQLKKTLGN